MPIGKLICIQNVSKEEFDVRDKIVMPPRCKGSLGTEHFIKGTGKDLTLRSMSDASVEVPCKLAI